MDKMILDNIKSDIWKAAKELLGDKLIKVVLYGSYARGDFNSQSDIDIALISKVPENRSHIYNESIGKIMTDLSLKYGLLVTFVIIREETFEVYKDILPFYRNILREGEVLYGSTL